MKKITKAIIELVTLAILLSVGNVATYRIGMNYVNNVTTKQNAEIDKIPVLTNNKDLMNDIHENLEGHDVFITGTLSSVTTVKYGDFTDDYILVKEICENKDSDGKYKIVKENIETALYARILDMYVNVNKIIFINPDINIEQNLDNSTRKEYSVIKNNSDGVLYAHISNNKIDSGKFYKDYSLEKIKEDMYNKPNVSAVKLVCALCTLCIFMMYLIIKTIITRKHKSK